MTPLKTVVVQVAVWTLLGVGLEYALENMVATVWFVSNPFFTARPMLDELVNSGARDQVGVKEAYS
jgi:hypothetical protein